MVLMTMIWCEGLREKRSFINGFLVDTGSDSCLKNVVLMANPIPWILSSSCALPIQKKHSHSWVQQPILLLQALFCSAQHYLPCIGPALAKRAVLLSGLVEASLSVSVVRSML